MKPDELEALKEYIAATISESIESALGRDSVEEVAWALEAEKNLDALIRGENES